MKEKGRNSEDQINKQEISNVSERVQINDSKDAPKS